MEKKIVNILLTIVVLILIAINIIIFTKNNFKKADLNETNENTVEENIIVNAEEQIENVITNKVIEMTEKERMQTYFGTFIKYIREKKYEDAYGLLNESFKSNYFPTLESFETYVQKYPKESTVDYQYIERQGELFVLTVQIKDMFDSSVEPISQRVVIRELGVNKFTLSFQVE